jgi:mitochondrial import inner membrane translocase subunit TIM54
MINGKRHGDLANKIADEIKAQRRIAVGIDPPPPVMQALAGYQPLDVMYKRKLEGGIVIVGRPTLKEFMAGTKKGWTEGLEKIDREEVLAHELESDGRFDEINEPSQRDIAALDGEPIPTPSKLPSGKGIYSPLQIQSPPPSQRGSESIPPEKNTAPAVIPELPPILFVPFTNLIGFTQIPLMMWDFFNQRHKVRSGSQAAYRLIMNHTRPIIPPFSSSFAELQDLKASSAQSLDQHGGDLNFDKEAESYFKSSLSSTTTDIEKARENYYTALPGKLETARALSRRTREPTKDEISYPPPTEVELRAERIKKELRWRGDIDGWELVRREKGVIWDDRFAASMRIFQDSTDDGGDTIGSISD